MGQLKSGSKEVNIIKMTPRLDILNRMPGVRIQPVGGGGGTFGPVVAKKSAPPVPPSYQEFYAGRDDFDSFQVNNSGSSGSTELDALRRVKKAHAEKVFATTDQKKILMDHYLMNNYPSIEDMARMTEVTGLDERFLKQWFQYTRKFMKSKGKAPVRIDPPPDSQGFTSLVPREKDFVSFQYDPMDVVETKIDKDSFTHEEAIEKAMQYDDLKKKFDDLHKNFMVMSSALLKKGYKGDNDPEPNPSSSQSQRSSPPIQEPLCENGKEEIQENGDKTLNGPFRPSADSTSTPLVVRVKQEKEEEGDKQAKKEPVENDENKDDPSKNINLPAFPSEANPAPYAPPYHPGPYPPHHMYPPYQNSYNPNLPPHMQPPPNWPPYQQPGWNPNYPPYGAPPGYPPANFPPPGQAPPGYPPAQPYPPPPNGSNFQPPLQPAYPGQTPPPSNPFHPTPPPPQVSGQTPPPPPFHQPQHPPYPPHPYHMQAPQYQNPQEPNNPPHPYSAYPHPQDPQMKIEETKVKTESVTPPPPDLEMTNE